MKLEIKLTPPARNRHKNRPYSSRVMSVLAQNYDRLKREFNKGKGGNFGAMSFEDIFQEVILYVIQDREAVNLSESEILNHFKYRYRMIQYQIIRDAKLIHQANADNIQAPEETE